MSRPIPATFEKRRYVVVIELPVDASLPLDQMPPELDAELDNDIGVAVSGLSGAVIDSYLLP